jgi:dihydrolipoamide dehydrogenase
LNYDIVILGGGPGGYVAAIRCSQLGLKTALIEKETLGGVCLNWGCIPTKALLKNAKVLQDMKRASFYGIKGVDIDNLQPDWHVMLQRKDRIVRQLTNGVSQLLQRNDVTVYHDNGFFIDKNTLLVGEEKLTAPMYIIATGARPQKPNIPGLEDGVERGFVITSKEVLTLPELPSHLVILGGGVIAVEYAALFNALGIRVTMIQRSGNILRDIESEMSALLARHLKDHGVTIQTNAQITEIGEGIVRYKHNGTEEIIKCDRVLLSLGMQSNLESLEALHLKTDNGNLATNEKMETSEPHIYAIGDVNGKYRLAHVASAEGLVAAENAAGGDTKLDYRIVPFCIYSYPEIASVGLTAEEAISQGFDVKESKFPLSANGKALAEGESIGFIKVVAEKKYGEILGTHIIAAHATDMISEAVISMQLEGTAYDVAKAIHPHPTLSEIVMEAALSITDQPIHGRKGN